MQCNIHCSPVTSDALDDRHGSEVNNVFVDSYGEGAEGSGGYAASVGKSPSSSSNSNSSSRSSSSRSSSNSNNKNIDNNSHNTTDHHQDLSDFNNTMFLDYDLVSRQLGEF